MPAPSHHPDAVAVAAPVGEKLTTRTGFRLAVRPAREGDEALLRDLFEHVTLDDLRFRFLSGMEHVGHDKLMAMLRVDHVHTETFLAFDREGGGLVATAMLAADPELVTAEVAISVDRDYKQRGIGWTLLEHVARIARATGIRMTDLPMSPPRLSAALDAARPRRMAAE